MRNTIIYNGKSSRELGLVVEYLPDQNRPSRKYDRYSVPGRNGDIYVFQNAWENTEQTYQVWSGTGTATQIGYVISEWLLSSTGYQRLEDSYDPDHYRLAAFVGAYDFENVLKRYGRAAITFDCDPRRFLKSGEVAYGFSATGTITNPTAFTAKPIITVHGSGSATVSCGGNTITISGIVDGMVLDCENQNAYSGSNNLNSLISGSFPVIEGGEQTITITGGITSIEVVPNWWQL